MSDSKTHQEPLLNDQQQEEEKKVESEVLTIEQVNACLEKIESMHPLKEADIWSVYPFLTKIACCLRKPKKNFKYGLRKALLEKLDIEMPETDEAIIHNPYLLLGYGFNAYFDVIADLVTYFFFVTIFTYPLFGIYLSQGDAMIDYTEGSLDQYTLGNFYGSSVQCIQTPMSLNSLAITCPRGVINMELLEDQADELIMIIPSDADGDLYCTSTALSEDSYIVDGGSPCDIDRDLVIQYLYEAGCDGASSCTLTDLADYLISNGDGTTSSECGTSSDAVWVTQVACYYDADTLQKVQADGLYIAAITVFVALFTVLFTDYVRSTQKNDFVEFDVSTITAGDYSIEFDVEDEVYESFLTQVYHDETQEFSQAKFGQTPNIAFREWIKKEFETRISRLPDLGYEDEIQEQIRISVCTLAFENGALIDLLKKRGTAIKQEDYNLMREIDGQIDELKNTPEKYDKLTFPCSVFFTFENEEGYNRAVQYHETVEDDEELADIRQLFGVNFELQEASEPTDIIWENRQYTPQIRSKRMALTILVILISLLISFAIVTALSDYAYGKKLAYGSPVCSVVYTNFGIDEDDFTDGTITTQAEFEDATQYLVNAANKEISSSSSDAYKSGYTNCYCGLVTDYGFTDDTEGGDACSTYTTNYYIALCISSSISFVLVIVNGQLQTITINWIEWVSHDTQSEQMTSITNWVFIAQFFNTAFVPLLVFANFSEQSTWLGVLFNGMFYDYSPLWFDYVGYLIVYTMGLNMVMGPMMMPVGWIQLWLFRKMDRSWTNDIYKTKQTSMQGYIDLYAGPGYIIHFKYSGVLNVVFVTLFYGIGQPILFPIALITLLGLWFVERYEIAYNYQLPPSLDDKLTKNCVKVLRWAPILLLFNTYWMLSNKQYFSNLTEWIQESDDQMKSQHYWDYFGVDQSAPVFIMSAFIFVIVISQLYFKKQLKKIGYVMSSAKISVDEDLPPFFTALKLFWCDWMVSEYHHYYEHYGVEIANREMVDTLDDTGVPKKTLQGIPFYSILSNPDYAKAFYYIDTVQPSREAQIKDDDDNEDNDLEQSDLVVLLLNLGCIPQKAAIQKFESGFNITFKQTMREFGFLKDEKETGIQ